MRALPNATCQVCFKGNKKQRGFCFAAGNNDIRAVR
jgi:hypothetical protein